LFWQAAEKALQRRSQSLDPLDVHKKYASGSSLLAALLEGLFEQPALRPSVASLKRRTTWPG